MLSTNDTYEFQRKSNGETVSLVCTISLYDKTPSNKTIYYRDPPGEETFKSVEVEDYSTITPIDKIEFSWNIPTNLQTSAQPADRSGSTPEKFTDFDNKLTKIRTVLTDDTEYTNTYKTLWDRHSNKTFTS
tara:strand:- start:60 stop:452 length:393 start_codon:yes stop_codon:yes gene_type:complete